MMYANDYGEYTPTVLYVDRYDEYSPVFYRVCPNCGRFVKADEKTQIPEYLGEKPNATCKKCGRVQMPFCCWYSEIDDEEDLNDR